MFQNQCAFCAISLIVSGCAQINVTRHRAAEDYVGTIVRLAVLLPSSDDFGDALSTKFSSSFKSEMQAQLQACQVTPLIYQLNSFESDTAAKASASIKTFAPDTVLVVQVQSRFIINGEERGESYSLTIGDLKQHRDIWKATIDLGTPLAILADRTRFGADLASKIVQQVAVDGILKSCPPSAKAA